MPYGDHAAIAIATSRGNSQSLASNENPPAPVNGSKIKKYFFGITELLLPLLFTIVFGSFIKGQWDKEVLQKHQKETFGTAFTLINLGNIKLLLDFIENRKLGILGHLLVGLVAATIFGTAIMGSLVGDVHIATIAPDLFASGAALLGVKDVLLLAHNVYKYIALKAQNAADQAVRVASVQDDNQSFEDPNLATYMQNSIKYAVGTAGAIFTLLGIITLLKYHVDGGAAVAIASITGPAMFGVFLYGAINFFSNIGDSVKSGNDGAAEKLRLVTEPEVIIVPSNRNDSLFTCDADYSKGRKYYILQENDPAEAKRYVIDEIRNTKKAAQTNNQWYGLTPSSHTQNKDSAIRYLKAMKSFYKGTKDINIDGVKVKSFAEFRSNIPAGAFSNPFRDNSDFQDIVEMAETYERKFGAPRL